MLAGARTLTASSESSGLLEGWSACRHTTARAHFWSCFSQLSRSLLVCKVCRSKLQIHGRRSRQVTWQFIRSIWCIVSGLHPRSVQQAHQSVGCFLLRPLATEHVRTDRLVRQRREGGLASQNTTCFFGLFAIGCLPECSFGSSEAGPNGAIPDSTALLPLSHSPRQTRSCGSTGSAPALDGLDWVRC